MMSKYLLLLFIPAIYASISIKITTGENEDDTSIEYTGENVEIISNKERQTFKIGDRDLKKAVDVFSGGRPNDVFVKSPTPWNDVYHRFNWDQVQRTLRPIRARVIGIHTKPVIVAKRVFENYSRVTAKFNAAISHSVEETVSNTWSKGGELSVGQDFTYKIGGSVGGTTKLEYTASWGNDTTKTKSAVLGTSTSIEVPLEPNQAVVATLTATHGTLEMEIDYIASLSGLVFANYPRTFKGHHFWAYPVDDVLKAAGLPNYVKSTEKISVGFYTSANVEIRDKKMSSNAGPLMLVPAGIISTGGTKTRGRRPGMPRGGLKNKGTAS